MDRLAITEYGEVQNPIRLRNDETTANAVEESKAIKKVVTNERVQSLTELCEMTVQKHIDIDNAVRVLHLAIRHEYSGLIVHTSEYIRKHLLKVNMREGYPNGFPVELKEHLSMLTEKECAPGVQAFSTFYSTTEYLAILQEYIEGIRFRLDEAIIELEERKKQQQQQQQSYSLRIFSNKNAIDPAIEYQERKIFNQKQKLQAVQDYKKKKLELFAALRESG
jgi:hypothetical protein